MAIHAEEIGALDGRAVMRFVLENARGARAQIVGYGGALAALEVADRAGRPGDVTLGFDDLAGYIAGRGYLGALIGRYGNRIAGARFALDGSEHRLAANDGANHLHGGRVGFDKAVWAATPRRTTEGPALELTHTSADGDEGYPGELAVRVTYTWSDDSALRIDYHATTDRPTVVNLTHHAYWNLAGHAAGSILGHELELAADRFAVVGPGLIPTGELRSVDGTPFDFRRATAIGARIDAGDPQLQIAGGYDHSFAITGADGTLRRAARLREPTTGRVLEVLTTEPAIQFYSGNMLDGARGKASAIYRRRSGLCLETQHFPDSPNQPAFPTTTLRPGTELCSTTVFRFLVDEA
ncbi:MAG TPA: aldose epimerase family protein [Kofleriaceae bacterium]|nr:aldose epimerase family protein [Kofleriaceae bacterium]